MLNSEAFHDGGRIAERSNPTIKADIVRGANLCAHATFSKIFIEIPKALMNYYTSSQIHFRKLEPV